MRDQPEKHGCLGFIYRLFGSAPAKPDPPSVSQKLPYRRKDWLFSRAERSFFGVLEQAVGRDFRIFAKVRLSDSLFVPGNSEGWRSHQNRIDSKHVDFLLCTIDEVRPVLVIELDDSSHGREDRKDRDAFLDRALMDAGLSILHVRGQRSYHVGELSKAIRARV